ncbi:MAG: hypothetical protein ACLR0N_02130 [Bilophila wadsworthia]
MGPIFLRAPPLNGFGFLSHRNEKQFSRKPFQCQCLDFLYDTLSNAFLDGDKGPFPFASNSKPGWAFFFFLQRRPLINWERREQGFDKKKSLRRMRGWVWGRGEGSPSSEGFLLPLPGLHL